jgi:hypothetical protein
MDVIDRVFVIRWYGPPKEEDAAAVIARVQEAKARLGAPLHYISLSGEVQEPFTEEHTKLLISMDKVVLPLVTSIALVLEGNGLKQNLLRVTFRTLWMGALMGRRFFNIDVPPEQAQKIKFYDTFETALEVIKGDLKLAPPQVIASAKEKGLALAS